MNSAHDLGGMHGYGPLPIEENEPVFHEEWERHAFAILAALLCQGIANADENRHAMERMGNLRYLNTPYFEHWLIAMETLMVEKGIIGQAELDDRVQLFSRGGAVAPPEDPGQALADTLLGIVRSGGSTLRDVEWQPRFQINDDVIAKNSAPIGHTRLPRYARGHRGRIVAYHGCHVFADANAMHLGEQAQPLYSVRFDAGELWGPDAVHRSSVHVDLWEDHLIPA